MGDLLDTAFQVDASWPWLLLLPPVVWCCHFAYHHTRPPVAARRVSLLWLLRGTSFCVLIMLLAEPVLSYLARHALRPVTVTLIDSSPSMEVERRGYTRLDRVRQAMNDGLGTLLDGPFRTFSSSAYDVDPDTLDRLQISGQATDLAEALRSAVRAVPDRRLLAGIVLLSDGRHNLGEDPVRTADEQGVPVYVLGLSSNRTPDDVQIVGVETEGPIFAGSSTRLQVRLRNWGFQDSSVVVRLDENDEALGQKDLRLGADGQLQLVELQAPPMSAGPHLLRVTVVPIDGELTPHNNQSLLSLRVQQKRLRVLLVADRPAPESAFVGRLLAADSTLRVERYVLRDGRGFYGTTPFPEDLGAFDALVLLEPSELTGILSPGRLRAYVAGGAGLLVQATGSGGTPAGLADLLPIMAGSAVAGLHDQEPLRLERRANHHPVGRGMVVADGAGDPWQRLPPLLARAPRGRLRHSGTALLAASTGDPVVATSTVGAGRIVHVVGSGFWRLNLFDRGSGDGRTTPTLWRDAVHWLAAAEPVGRVRASTEQPFYPSGAPVTVVVEVHDKLNAPLQRAQVELSLEPAGSRVLLEPQRPGHYRTTFSGLAADSYTFRVTARHGVAEIGQSVGTFVVEGHTVESGDLRADPEMLATIARASGGQYRDIEQWGELAHFLQPRPTIVHQQRRLGAEIRHVAWLVLLTGLLTSEWILRKRSGML